MSSEAAVRSALRKHICDSSDRQPPELVDEFWVPLSHERVDLAVIGSVLESFEIKTARDNLERLPRQVEAYSRIFDCCTAVIAERHAERVVTMVPSWWGVLVVVGDDTPTFEVLRNPSHNATVDPPTLVRLLWRDEVHSALVNLGSEPPPRTSRVAMWEELLRVAHIDALRAIVRQALLGREPTRARIQTRRFAANFMATAGP